MEANLGGSSLANNQFGFRKGRSTCDAVDYVQSKIKDATNKRKLVLVVSLDIKNAFNSKPHKYIRR